MVIKIGGEDGDGVGAYVGSEILNAQIIAISENNNTQNATILKGKPL